MTERELRAFLEDPAQQHGPEGKAMRAFFAKYDEERKRTAQLLDNYPDAEAARMDLEIALGRIKTLQWDNQRLRQELSKHYRAPWDSD
jgi:hypothetical protein